MKKALNVWGVDVALDELSPAEEKYLRAMAQKNKPTVEWVWAEMDRVWNELGLDNRRPLNQQPIDLFYSHPVWLLNGIFTASDEQSLIHRQSIADFVISTGSRLIADYGGGFGELALQIANRSIEISVDIIEPYPSPAGLDRASGCDRIHFRKSFSKEYDFIILQDVLEHVEDPVGLATQVFRSVKHDGYVLFANCFLPVIQCHLPSTFHLRHTFPLVIKAMGPRYIKCLDDARHAHVFKCTGSPNLQKARMAERISKLIGPRINDVRSGLSWSKNRILG